MSMIPMTAYSPTVRRLPAAATLPIVGGLPYLLKQPFAYLQQAQRDLGDIFQVNLGVTSIVALGHPRHAQHILRDNVRNYRKGGNMWTSVRTMFGNGLVVSEGDFWLRQRRMMQPHFHRRYLAGLFDLMLAAIDEQMVAWPTTDKFDLTAALNRMTMNVIVRTMFGTRLDENDFQQLSEAMAFAMDYLLVGVIQQSLPSWLHLPGHRRYVQALRTFDEIVYRVIARCRADQDDTSLLTMLLNTVDAETGEQMTDQQLRDEAATIFVAGYETTSIALSWAADFLARDNALQQRLATEIDTVAGQDAPDLTTLSRLKLARHTFQEALRLRPSAWFLPRLAVEDDEIDGYPIPAGTQVALLISHIHQHPESWEAPDQFNPDRFEDDDRQTRHPFAYVPFGAGQRQCIGRDFAYMEGQLILTRLLQRFQLHPIAPEPAQPQLSTTLRPKGGVHLRLQTVNR